MNNSIKQRCGIIAICVCCAAFAVLAQQQPKTTAPAAQANTENKPTSPPKSKAETRCGWFANPTPANASFYDRDGEWTISVQGGYQAEGDWPNFDRGPWVKTNINYGYGCACMQVQTDAKERRILNIESARVRPLAACRRDPALKKWKLK